MAEKKKAATKSATKKPVKSVKATEVKTAKVSDKPEKAVAVELVAKKRSIRAPRWLAAFGGYFKGAWQELRQVRWPNNRATWGLTLAVILFSLFFSAMILGLDSLFQYLFKEILL